MITNVKNIIIKKSILHIINKRNSHYNTTLLPNESDEFNNFLIKHIRASARAKSRKTATFYNKEINIPFKYISNLFVDITNFIDNSTELAQKLSNICTIKNHGPYDFIVCEYENEDSENYIAIILLESTTGFFHEIPEKDNDAIIKQLTVFASSNSNLKKCALIPYDTENLEFDLLINDRSLAEFFIHDFLSCEIYMDDRKATETFIEKTIVWVNEKCTSSTIDLDTKKKLEEIKSECISSINTLESVDITAFEDSFFRDSLEKYKEEYDTELENAGIINRQINLSPEVTNDYKFQKIKLENETELKIPVALLDNNTYNESYDRNLLENGEYQFKLKGKIISETVKSR